MAVAIRKPALLIVGALTVAYPLLVWFGMGKVSPSWLALLLVALVFEHYLLHLVNLHLKSSRLQCC